MSAFDPILAWGGDDAVGRAARWLGVRLGASVHELPAGETVTLGEAIGRHGARLVVLGAAAHDRIGECPVPMLVLPARYREAFPWRSMLVAASGERAADQALETAAHLATELRLSVAVAYCEGARPAPGAVGAYADAVHYEYAGRLSAMVSRALAGAPAEEGDWVREVLLCRGDAADELLGLAVRRGDSVLAMGCHGELGAGRAAVLKRLLAEAECPLLVVRQAPRPRARLRVGSALEEGD